MQMTKVLALFAVLAFIAAPVWADWDPSQPAKWVQLPDPTGWDVDITTDWVYDDWMCTGTGPISDIHFWMSWDNDYIGQIQQVLVQIRSDVPAGQGLPYSHPDGILWQGGFNPNQFIVRPAGYGEQGWISPSFTVPQWNRPDHFQFFQVNIPEILDPFIQTEGQIYWLGLHIIPAPPEEGMPYPMAGWKTSINHWNDDAAYYYGGWKELVDPQYPTESLDMAFVLTTIPEPATVVLLMLGLVGVRAVSRRAKK
jgi:hypothetical protein